MRYSQQLIRKRVEVIHHGMSEYFNCPRIGASMGTLVINDILYVDDTTDANNDINDTVASHNEVVNFSKMKRLSLNHKKCCIITVNKKSTDSVPTLHIDDGSVQHVTNTKFLGDIINEKGTNIDMVNEREKKGNAVIVNCLAICNEVTMGTFFYQNRDDPV